MRVAHALLTVVLASAAVTTVSPAAHAAGRPELPAEVYGGAWQAGHVQGIAVDEKKGYMYFSFTNLLVKTDLSGKPVGSVTGFTGHLGDLDLNPRDGRVYGSLEYKDAQAFYIAIFDVDRVTSLGMDAETSDVVTAVHLQEVADDYSADMNGDGVFDGNVADTPDHRYGCSGIDGLAFGPEFGKRHGKQRLTVAYGVYSNVERQDNDHQVLLQYDTSRWRAYERPLTQAAPHTSGPARPDGKYFVRTGNTRYGVQNLEYDRHTGRWLMAVYKGAKPQFPNYSLFAVDGAARPVRGPVEGQPRPEQGDLLALVPEGLQHAESGVRGWESAGQYGLASLDDGRFYLTDAGTVTEDGVTKQTAHARLHRWTGRAPNPFERLR
ncbi:hypothetical protein OUY22_31645 [Nonomuraea sp. MCN248]|uniref:Phytase-like domain-containing protein n=1 Tax=Nonomuraea corallina TaxID=2989783 RepID=A0ABT4SL74_9ACTN|nr:hypothetical protein [Nonomuraea corallina]MDA0637986.1 hypothetical protein [Nonomuraea corallina]